MERLDRLIKGLVLLLSCSGIAEARLGETPSQFTDRYGIPQQYVDSTPGIMPPFLKGARVKKYQKGDWIVIAAFFDITSPAVRVRFQKKNFTPLTSEEILAILQANCTGMTWRPDAPNHAGEAILSPFFRFRRWKRDDGATAFLQNNTLELDSPAVAKHEAQIKQKRLQKARENRPDF